MITILNSSIISSIIFMSKVRLLDEKLSLNKVTWLLNELLKVFWNKALRTLFLTFVMYVKNMRSLNILLLQITISKKLTTSILRKLVSSCYLYHWSVFWLPIKTYSVETFFWILKAAVGWIYKQYKYISINMVGLVYILATRQEQELYFHRPLRYTIP